VGGESGKGNGDEEREREIKQTANDFCQWQTLEGATRAVGVAEFESEKFELQHQGLYQKKNATNLFSKKIGIKFNNFKRLFE